MSSTAGAPQESDFSGSLQVAGPRKHLRPEKLTQRLSHRFGDRLFNSLTFLFAAGIASLVVIMIVAMAMNSNLAFGKFGISFLWTSAWDPVKENFGAWPFIYGTVASALISLIISVPISVGLAIFLVEQAPLKISESIGFVVQLLAAIPSVVYGLWAIFVLAPILRNYVYPAL